MMSDYRAASPLGERSRALLRAVVAGSGRTADAIAGALVGESSDERAERLAETGLIDTVPLDEPAALARLLGDVIGQGLET